LVASRQNFCFRKQSFLPRAAQTHSVSVPRGQRFRLVFCCPCSCPLCGYGQDTPSPRTQSLLRPKLTHSGADFRQDTGGLFPLIPGTVCYNCHSGV
jgi:hypothetical protein